MSTRWTFQSLILAKKTLTAHCHNPACHHSDKLNLDLLSDHFGPDAPAMPEDLEPKLVCAKCKGKNVGLTYSADDPPAPASSKNLYSKAKGG